MLKRIAVLCGILLVALPVFAGKWNKKTLLTFNQTVEVPGALLPPGQYIFKIVDSTSDRNIVQVFSADESKIYTTILAISHYRMQPADETVILFAERPATQPQAIHAWHYPGEIYGQEFVYPQERAVELARATSQPVLSGDVRPSEPIRELERTPVVAVTPENEEVKIVEPLPVTRPAPVQLTAPPVMTEEATPVLPEKLPETGTSLPLIALLGASSLGLGVLLTLIRRHST